MERLPTQEQDDMMTPRDATTTGLDIYRAEMRDVIRRALQSEFGGDWCRTQAAPLFGGRKEARMLIELDRGERPENLFDVGEFQRIIAAHQQLFPEAITIGEYHNHMPKIATVRNRVLRALDPVFCVDAQESLGWCIEVLEQCGRTPAATEIRDIVSSI